MSSPVRLASFCRLCLSKTKDKVPIFANGDMLDNLLHLIEIQIEQEEEPDAVVCYDCVVTLEGFHQFKEQCHVNDEFVRTVPPKLDCSASSAELGERVGDESEEDEDNQDEAFLREDKLEEDDHLELSEAEEVFQERPRRKVAAKKKKKVVKTPKKSPPRKPVTKQVSKASVSKKPIKKEPTQPQSTVKLDDLQVLADSYPDYFYFEKGARSIYYTIVFYGERYNSALFTERYTYWQCTHRRRFQCPAQVVASNDYKSFERRYEHTHRQLADKEGQAFTPHEALPEIFQICKRIVLQKRAKNVRPKSSFEDKFQEFATDTKVENDDDDEPDEADSLVNESKESLTADDSDDEDYVASRSRPKRQIKPNARYAAEGSLPKKRAVEPQSKPKKKQTIEKNKSKKQSADETSKSRVAVKREQEIKDMDTSDSEDHTEEEEEEEEEELDLAKIEEECEALKVPKKPSSGPSLDEQLVLADSYPDYFFFEKGPRSIYFTLVYYGERYHSAMFTEHYTYWQCRHRRKYKCPAQVCVSNDYKMFERRYNHTHPDLPDKEGQAFTPTEALPELFEACRKVVLRKRAIRRKKLLDKYKFLKSIDSLKSEDPTSNIDDEIETVEVEEYDEEAYEGSLEDELVLKDIEYVEEELVETTED